MKNSFHKLTLIFFLLGANTAFATQSTINTTIPVQGAPLQSAPIRNNFIAAYNDINNLYGLVGTGTRVSSINGASGGFTFTGNGVSCTSTTCTFTGLAGGSAGGDLGGTYPNPTVLSVGDVTTGTLPAANGGTGNSTGTITLGTSASVTNPQRSGQAGTGLFSTTSNIVSVASGGVRAFDLWSGNGSTKIDMYGYHTMEMGTLTSLANWEVDDVSENGDPIMIYVDESNAVCVGWETCPGAVGGPNTIIGGQVATTTLSSGTNNILIGTGTGTDTAGASDTHEIAIGGRGLGSNTTEIGLSGTTTATTIYGSLSVPSLSETGVLVCMTSSHVMGHCTAAASCTSTCTCTCTAN